MSFQSTPPINLAEFGLFPDVPSNVSPTSAWTSGKNLRCKDGSVQGVNSFSAMSVPLPAGYTKAVSPIAVTQWTRAGSGSLELAIIVKGNVTGEGNRGKVFLYNGTTTVDITGTTSDLNFDIDDNYPPQIFVFNELLIVNPGTGIPTHSVRNAAGTASDMLVLPGFKDLAGSTATSFPRVLRPFGNRLVAMNWHDLGNTVSIADDSEQPIDFVWSSTITSIGSLAGAVWQGATTNSAGDAFLTSTPGVILDGIQLGGVFLAFKTDSIVRVTEIGSPFHLGFDSIYEDDGMYSTGCAANIGNDSVLVIGNYGVSILDPQQNKQDIAKGIFKEALYAAANPLHKNRAFVFQQTRDKEVWFCYSSISNTGAGCNSAFVYDYDAKKLHIRTLPNVLGMFETEIAGTLRIFGASPENGIQELSSTAHEADGEFTIENKLGEDSSIKGLVGIKIKSENNLNVAATGTFNILDSKTYTNLPIFDPSSTYKVDCRVSGRYISLRVTMDGTKNPKLTTMTFDLVQSGRR